MTPRGTVQRAQVRKDVLVDERQSLGAWGCGRPRRRPRADAGV